MRIRVKVTYHSILILNFFWGPLGLFHFMKTVFPLALLYPEHSQQAFDFVVIACSLDSIRPALGCKAPNVVG